MKANIYRVYFILYIIAILGQLIFILDRDEAEAKLKGQIKVEGGNLNDFSLFVPIDHLKSTIFTGRNEWGSDPIKAAIIAKTLISAEEKNNIIYRIIDYPISYGDTNTTYKVDKDTNGNGIFIASFIKAPPEGVYKFIVLCRFKREITEKNSKDTSDQNYERIKNNSGEFIRINDHVKYGDIRWEIEKKYALITDTVTISIVINHKRLTKPCP
jgi:hypothetical protein